MEHIEGGDLEKMLDLLLKRKTGTEYRPAVALDRTDSTVSERDILEERRRKKETALNRLKALYLYGDEEMPEKDYIIQREEIGKELSEIEARLTELQASKSDATISSTEFIQRASYFIMVEKLLDDRYIDYEKYIRRIDPSIPRNFITNIIDHIVVTDGRVQSITFKNGMTHHFSYKE